MEGYETGEHAPGLKLKGTGAYRAAHHIIKVRTTQMTAQYPLILKGAVHPKLKFFTHLVFFMLEFMATVDVHWRELFLPVKLQNRYVY